MLLRTLAVSNMLTLVGSETKWKQKVQIYMIFLETSSLLCHVSCWGDVYSHPETMAKRGNA